VTPSNSVLDDGTSTSRKISVTIRSATDAD